ncbi:MAG: thiamine pyrophosphate-binding protein [Actinomycetota bacterium]|nr:thiamine pyrophosphate-binding protein [Actinomycetota bacterium]
MAVAPRTGRRLGGHVVVEALAALGVRTVFGLPGIPALGIWEGLRTGPLRYVGLRTELNAGFAADGYARVSGRPTPLLLSTGPGALNSLTALMEAASAYVPVVAIASQVPTEMIGRGRGYLHELPDQRASFEPIVKWTAGVGAPGQIASTLAEAFRRACAPPTGPVYVEIPVDVLTAPTDAPGVPEAQATASAQADGGGLDEAAALLAQARRPVVWGGGGVLRSGAWSELVELAERLHAPVVTTYMGKGAIREDHPLAAGSGCDEAGTRELLEGADLLLAVGTEMGAETTGQYGLAPSGRLIQIDAVAERIGATYPALGLVGDARAVLAALIARLREHEIDSDRALGADTIAVGAAPPAGGTIAARDVRERVARGLEAQGSELERGLLQDIRSVLPREMATSWDMTILGYWAAAHFPVLAPRRFLYPLGSGTLGYAWPAALGASIALDEPVLAVVGDGGSAYGLAELASARQHGVAVKLLIIDDGGYGILREYQQDAHERCFGVELAQPDFTALARAFEVPVRETAAERLREDLLWALGVEGPVVLVLRARLTASTPTP